MALQEHVFLYAPVITKDENKGEYLIMVKDYPECEGRGISKLAASKALNKSVSDYKKRKGIA